MRPLQRRRWGNQMHISTGKYKKRTIELPAGIRPTQDKVRKAVFDILGDVEGLQFLELYAGSGAVGLEALSRGARHVTFVESAQAPLRALRTNVERFGAGADCDILPAETEKALIFLEKKKQSFDIVFLDPPYYPEQLRRGTVPRAPTTSETKKTLQTLGACDIVRPDGFAIAQHAAHEALPASFGSLALIKQSRYGDTVVSFYKAQKQE